MEPLSIRPADAQAIAAVHVHSWQWGYRGQIPDEILENLDIAQRARDWLEIMTAPHRTASLYLADRSGLPVGSNRSSGR
jgi:hypothetical protein